MDEIVSFGSWLKQRRSALDLTQADLAHRAGCTTATIKKIEQDERRPSRETHRRMAVALEPPNADHPTFVESAWGLHAADRLAIPPPSGQRTPFGARCALTNLPVQRTPLIGRALELV